MAVNDERAVSISHHFDGVTHLDWSEKRWYKNPRQEDLEAMNLSPMAELHRHRDLMSRISHKPRDLLRYIHPENCKPGHMLVQATEAVYERDLSQGDWRRVRLKGHAPMLLSVSAWAIGPKKPHYTKEDIFETAGRILITTPVHLIYLLFPTGSVAKYIHPNYTPFPCRSWEYPKYARNPLDASPNAPQEVIRMTFPTEDGAVVETTEIEPVIATYNIVGEQHRLIKPRLLVVCGNDSWNVVPGNDEPYIFISYTTIHFNTKDPEGLRDLERLAEEAAKRARVKAYWLDAKCRANEQPELSKDVHGIYDVVRGAQQVCVMLPDLETETLANWGSRMWTLPEALLSSNQIIKFCTPTDTVERKKLSLASGVWPDDTCSRLLAEHYTGVLNLSRIELITVALEALATRYALDKDQKPFSKADIAYALMALLQHRPSMNPGDTLFQALARLSLANDSDRIVERMICMLPDHEKASHESFILHDRLSAKLWDIEPTCQVAGVCDDREIILDGCRGISIRWKDIPQIVYARRFAWKRVFAKMAVRSASLWFIIGAWISAIYPRLGVPLLLLGIALLFYAPWGVCTVYGGKIWNQSAWLVGFEGVLPIEDIERKTFGNYIGRLSYAPSSNMYSNKAGDERVGINPAWFKNESAPRPALPRGHRLFTLIDTGSMTVSIFSAERPPSVALICGKEGGMLRVVLCSYERSTNCLYKESVLRMETPMLDRAGLLGWIKIAERGLGVRGKE